MDMVILIDTPGLQVIHDSRHLPGEVAARVIQAAALVDQAQHAADLIQEEARQAAEKIRQQAHCEFEQERNRGWQEGWKAAQDSLAEALADAAAARQVALHALVPDLVDLVLDATAKLIQGIDRRHLFARAFDSVNGLLHQAKWARLRVAPQQISEASAALNAADEEIVRLVTLVADPALGIDDAIFESDRGVCNASLSVQLKALSGALSRAVAVIQGQASQAGDIDPHRKAA